MNNQERLKLKELMNNSMCYDNTNEIRRLKHSMLIKNDIDTYLLLKKDEDKYDKDEFHNIIISKCFFLYSNYTDIFHKLIKNELNLNIVGHLLNILKKIEDGDIEQEEGSVYVGKILKEMYIDSAIKTSNNLEKNNNNINSNNIINKKNINNISWNDYKKIYL